MSSGVQLVVLGGSEGQPRPLCSRSKLVDLGVLVAPGIALGSLLGIDICSHSQSHNLQVAVICRYGSSQAVPMYRGTGGVTPHSTKMARLEVTQGQL